MNTNSVQELQSLAVAAIRMVRHHVRWKPDKDVEHLDKRIRRGHLPPGAGLDQYNQLIQKILTDPESNIYHYPFGQADYFSITSAIEGQPWLVLISAKGFMETAFPPDDMQDYIVQSKYVFLGKLKELIP
ncbi:MAG: hypothetical protein ALAOOOJD_04225 [bacterium]|nr:hypothetical protein [bacterium]